MPQQFLGSASPFIRFLFLLFLALLSFLVLSIAGTLIAIPLFGVSLTDLGTLPQNLNNPDAIRLLKYLQFVQSFSLFLIPALLFLLIVRDDGLRSLRLKKFPGMFQILLVVMLMMALVPLNNLLAEWNSNIHLPDFLGNVENWIRNMEEKATRLTEAFLRMDNFGSFLFNLVLIAVLPAIGEELMFRGAIQPLMQSWTRNVHAGIWITAFLFSFFHFQFLGFLPRLLLGAIFGYLFSWSRSLWLPVLAHFVNNGMAVTFYYVVGQQEVENSVDKIGTAETGAYALLGGIVVSGILFVLYRHLKSHDGSTRSYS